MNKCSGQSQATTFWGVVNKKVHTDSWEQRAEAQAGAGCPITADARKLYKRMDAEAKRNSAYCKTQEAKASKAQGKKGPKSVAAAQVSRKAFNALGEHAAEHGRGALKDTSQARLDLHGLRQELKAVTNELEGGYRALSQEEQDKKKRKQDVSEVEHVVELGNVPLNKGMITYRKKKVRLFTEQIEAAVKKLREDEKENFELAEEAVRVEGLRFNRSSTDRDYMGNEFVR